MTIRPLTVVDSPKVQSLIADCPPLDIHTPYTYWTILSRKPSFCFGAWKDDELLGVVLAIPSGDSVFVWQIGVLSADRGQGIARALLDKVLTAANHSRILALEATVGPENDTSRKLFGAFASSHGFELTESDEFAVQDASGQSVGEERLLQIGLG